MKLKKTKFQIDFKLHCISKRIMKNFLLTITKAELSFYLRLGFEVLFCYLFIIYLLCTVSQSFSDNHFIPITDGITK